ncbi:MAG: GxxExxY protein [Cocleimonas sp.]|nr:GxxExxY protein [Cocleimonas sp.]
MLQEKDLTYKIRGCIYEVYRELGAGFIERVYENALELELTHQGLTVQRQHALAVSYKEIVVGEFVVELKAVQKLQPVHEAQLLNYLNVAGIKIGLLVNFVYPKSVVKRIIL